MSSVPTAGLGTTVIGGRPFLWGERTYVMGIVNATPDSFSGDGLAAASPADPVAAALELAARMAAEGADLLDVGGESTRPGHAAVSETEELRRVVPIVAAVHAAQPDLPISVDTTKPAVAAAALDAGAALINHVWGVADDDALARLAAERDVPIVLMHNRVEPSYVDLMTEIVADLERAIVRALQAGCRREALIVDPGFGFGKTADHNLVLLRELDRLRVLGRPILLGTSRKSTLGRVLDLPPDDRLEATLVTTTLGIAAGVDIVRVHDVAANVRAARMTDAIIRGRVFP
ncbi:MAG: dihydropteroate synthase [Candidatus Limnocylindrales bacterium]